MPIGFDSTKRLLVVAIVAIVAVLAVAMVFSGFFNGPENWANVASWSGQETEYSTRTEPFTINGRQWHVNWQAVGYDNSSRCYVSVYDADTNQLIMDLPRTYQSGIVYFETKGTFYLKIETHGTLRNWSVQVRQTA